MIMLLTYSMLAYVHNSYFILKASNKYMCRRLCTYVLSRKFSCMNCAHKVSIIYYPLKFPGCKTKSFWLLARHGSRNPGDDDISQMEIRGPEIQAAIIDNHQSEKGNLNTNALSFYRFQNVLCQLKNVTVSSKPFVQA